MTGTTNYFPPRSQRDKTPTVAKGTAQVNNSEPAELATAPQLQQDFSTTNLAAEVPLSTTGNSSVAPIPATQNESKIEAPRWTPVQKHPEISAQVNDLNLPSTAGLKKPQSPTMRQDDSVDTQRESEIIAPRQLVSTRGEDLATEVTQQTSMPVRQTLIGTKANTQTSIPESLGKQRSFTAQNATPEVTQVLVHLQDVRKYYGKGETLVKALDGVSVDIYAGEFTAIVGASGSGKSTMLHCLAGLDSITGGTINVAGQHINMMGDNQLTKFRREYIGFIFQAFNLVPTLTALENITLPQKLAKQKTDQEWLDKVVNALGLANRLSHKPSELSGGQQQRVAVARALVAKPALLVADEPTGNLDKGSSSEVLKMLRDAVDHLGQSVVMVTHDRRAAMVADRVLVVSDGKIIADMSHPSEEELAQVI